MFEEITAENFPDLFQDRFRNSYESMQCKQKGICCYIHHREFQNTKDGAKILKAVRRKSIITLKKKKKKEAVITTSELSETLHFIIKPSSLKIAGRLGALCCRPSPPPLVLTSSSLPCSHSVVVPHFREHTITFEMSITFAHSAPQTGIFINLFPSDWLLIIFQISA